METSDKNQNYISPKVLRIDIDNEIALQLESTPPHAPGEALNQTPEYYLNDPFRTNKG